MLSKVERSSHGPVVIVSCINMDDLIPDCLYQARKMMREGQAAKDEADLLVKKFQAKEASLQLLEEQTTRTHEAAEK